MDVVSLPQTGGCYCGAIRYSLNAAPLLAYACHCHDCQTRSGSAFGLTVVVRSADVTVSGEPEVVRLANPSGLAIDHNMCPHCRLRVFAVNPKTADYMSLRAGTLDDASWVRPVAQTWVESAIPWAVIPGVRAVAPEDFDFVRLGREWAATAPRFEPA
ncbi:GFA family protein [Phenylobacterium soli]|uniref:Aldehyde-activating protein n=1 Tax=Phenylobacterium soli TaxID=2170551 RepID=A0A328AK07_9CAUL|nr:GFA family protein [Phenylobacterium soli]RAK54735.1 aldehyde-activating protein [Phenylobacterium soli]